MLNKEDKDGIIEFLKSALEDLKAMVNDITLDPDLLLADERTIQDIKDKVDHTLMDITW